MEKVKWGVIGSGGIARRRTIPEGIIPSNLAELVAVYDINTAANEAVASDFKVSASKSIHELLDSDIEAVYVASPVNMHFDHVIECARAKKHVLCEKPLGLTVREAEQMIDVCKNEGVTLCTGFMMRFHTQHEQAKILITEGKLGKPVYGRAQLSCWYPPIADSWRQNPAMGGGGSLVDMGSHCIDLLQWFLGEISEVNCVINNNVHPYKSEDSAVVTLYFENGAFATVDAYFCIPDNSSKNTLELYGSKGSIIARGTIGQGDSGQMTAYLEEDISDYNAQQVRNNGAGMNIDPKPVNTYLGEIDEFCKVIRDGAIPRNNSTAGLQNMKIIEACYKSAKTKRTVEITD